MLIKMTQTEEAVGVFSQIRGGSSSIATDNIVKETIVRVAFHISRSCCLDLMYQKVHDWHGSSVAFECHVLLAEILKMFLV